VLICLHWCVKLQKLRFEIRSNIIGMLFYPLKKKLILKLREKILMMRF